MGTSQSFKLSTKPNWTSAKSAMTKVCKAEGDVSSQYSNFMNSFAKAVNYGSIDGQSSSSGERNSRHVGGGSSFGHAGSRIARGFISVLGNIRDNSLRLALETDQPGIDYANSSPLDILLYLYEAIVGDDSATMDDEAARCAMKALLFQMIGECKTSSEIEDILKVSSNEQVADWLLDFEVNYIIEYSDEIFQEQIYKHSNEPQGVSGRIKGWLRQAVFEKMKDEMHGVDLLAENGRKFVLELTEKILDIWKPE